MRVEKVGEGARFLVMNFRAAGQVVIVDASGVGVGVVGLIGWEREGFGVVDCGGGVQVEVVGWRVEMIFEGRGCGSGSGGRRPSPGKRLRFVEDVCEGVLDWL